jgi:hypothetical protein
MHDGQAQDATDAEQAGSGQIRPATSGETTSGVPRSASHQGRSRHLPQKWLSPGKMAGLGLGKGSGLAECTDSNHAVFGGWQARPAARPG